MDKFVQKLQKYHEMVTCMRPMRSALLWKVYSLRIHITVSGSTYIYVGGPHIPSDPRINQWTQHYLKHEEQPTKCMVCFGSEALDSTPASTIVVALYFYLIRTGQAWRKS